MPFPFDVLRKEKFVNLVTRRRNGVEVNTPMWFILEGERIYMRTGADSGKAKRIRNDGRVWLAPSNARGRETGPRIAARATVADPGMLAAVDRGIAQKYGLMKRLIDFINRVRGVGEVAVLELVADTTPP